MEGKDEDSDEGSSLRVGSLSPNLAHVKIFDRQVP